MELPLSETACATLGAALHWRDDSPSTNVELVAMAGRAALPSSSGPLADLTVVVTDTQTAGRGRLDRAWSTPPAMALAVSVFVAHPPHAAEVAGSARRAPDAARWGWLPLLAGVAMTRVVRELGVPGAGLKWPNDVLVGGRKLSGILTELTTTGVVIGSGLNLSMRSDQLPVATATSLVLEGVEPADDLLDRALSTYLRELGRLVARWREAEHPRALRPLVEEHLHTLGLAVRVDRPGLPRLRGTAEGLDDDGRLLVRPSAGSAESVPTSGLVAVAAGDVTHLRYE